ncbi:MAG: hypothetical protein RJA44_574, partial [Pseudomonadota bacterium]
MATGIFTSERRVESKARARQADLSPGLLRWLAPVLMVLAGLAPSRAALSSPLTGQPGPAPVADQGQPVKAGQTIKDCDVCPELVLLPRGSFMMGSPDSEPGRSKDEGPVHRVTIDHDLAVGRYEVTQGQWQALMGGNPSSFKACGDNCPVEMVSWNEAQDYISKLNARSGQTYRLLSEAEWEYAARAGTTTPFHTGPTITTDQANFDGNAACNGCAPGAARGQTVAVGRFAPNGFGLHDMHGNVREWVQDVHHGSYVGAPGDGS